MNVSIIGTVGVPANYGGFESLVENIIGDNRAVLINTNNTIIFNEQKWENYNFSDKPYMGNHELGKDGVAVVKFAMGAGALVKGIKEAGEKFEKASIKTVINSVKDLVEDVVKKRGRIRQNIIELAESKQYAKLYATKIGIKDADFAKETAEMTRLQILQQASSSVLSQANARPQSALQLLGN